MSLETMSTIGLVAMHNALSDTPLKAWKNKKSILIDRIMKLQSAAEQKETDRIAASKKTTTEKPVAKSKETIGGFTNALLVKIVGYVNTDGDKVAEGTKGAHALGMSYNSILDEVKKKFPGCKTNYNCLRCYAGRLRESGADVPVYRKPSKWGK